MCYDHFSGLEKSHLIIRWEKEWLITSLSNIFGESGWQDAQAVVRLSSANEPCAHTYYVLLTNTK